MKHQFGKLLLLVVTLIFATTNALAQTSAFTYQGKLGAGGSPANGDYQFECKLFSDVTAGSQIGSTQTVVATVTNGGFTTQLDFGVAAFPAGKDRWLEISVRLNGSADDYTVLSPRQQVNSVPFSVRSLKATNADNADNATNAVNATTATTATTAGNVTGVVQIAHGGTGSSTKDFVDLTTNQTIHGRKTFFDPISGDGSGLTNLPNNGFSWQEVTGTSVQAQSNHGYIANNDTSQVTVILPASPNVGDVVRVSGGGLGGWKIAQNAGQAITRFNTDLPLSWTPHESNRVWQSVASSADGTKLVAANGQIYTSADSGATWTPRESSRVWNSVASSADGTKLVAVVTSGQIYTSTDSGATWTPRESNRGWLSVASSADGTKLVAVVGTGTGGQIYTSTDSGLTWTPRESVRSWESVASSTDGTKLVAVVNGGQIYTSTDSGANWTPSEFARTWRSVASSADGTKLVAVGPSGQIYISTDSGATWTPRESVRSWLSVASSADGTKLVAVVNNGQIYASTDSGVTWTPRESNRNWRSVASSADGSKLVAVVTSGQIYTAAIAAIITTTGVNGYLSGGVLSAIELQYIGGGKFIWLSHEGDISTF